MKDLFFRLNLDINTGFGHFIRMYSLAKIISNKFNIFFVMKYSSNIKYKQIKKQLSDYSIKLIFIKKDLDLINICKNTDSVIFDMPFIKEELQIKFKNFFKKVIIVDDENISKYYHADLIINQNIYAYKFIYNHPKYCKKLIGSKFFIYNHNFKINKKKNI